MLICTAVERVPVSQYFDIYGDTWKVERHEDEFVIAQCVVVVEPGPNEPWELGKLPFGTKVKQHADIDVHLLPFMIEMTRKLRERDLGRGVEGWNGATWPDLVRRKREYDSRIEMHALVNPHPSGDARVPKPADLAIVANAAINAANHAMMIWERATRG